MGWLGDIGRGIVNFAGKGVRVAAKVKSTLVQLPGKAAGMVIRTGTELAGGAVGLISERLGGVVRDAGKAAAGVVETPGRIAGHIIEQTANKGTEFVSSLAGDLDGEIDAWLESDCAEEDFAGHWGKLWDAAKNAKEGFTGERCYKLAKEHLRQLKEDQKKRQEEVTSRLKEQSDIIQEQLCRINGFRSQAGVLFRRFEQLSSAFSVWKIRNRVFKEHFSSKNFTFTKLKADKDFFYKVDFDSLLTTFEAWMTAGILIESRVKEAEEMIEGSRKAFEDESRAAQEEIKRYKKIAESLTFVKECFVFFTDFYKSLLDELGYSIDLLREAGYMRSMFFFAESDEKLNPAFLPNRHIRCLQACDKLSRLLCDLAKRKYFDDSEVEIIECDRRRVEKYRVRFVEPLTKQFAA